MGQFMSLFHTNLFHTTVKLHTELQAKIQLN